MTPARILVVDDELELQRLIKQRFRKQIQANQMDFVFASNGVEAMQKLQQDRQIDMVLTDINMPDMDGLAFIQRLPEISVTLKAVMISAYGDMPRVRQAMNGGAFDFLTKPLDFQDLERTIERTLAVVRRLKDQQLEAQTRQEELRQAAFHDELTDLPNRTWLNQHLQHLFKQRKQAHRGAIALLFIDLDGFKPVNDRLGHLIGDRLLNQVAQRLKLCLREGDLAARMGGDEFVIVLEDVQDVAIAVTVADRLEQQLIQPFDLDGLEAKISASIGIAMSSQGIGHPEDLLRAADVAMYAAKAQGKGCYVIFDEATHQA